MHSLFNTIEKSDNPQLLSKKQVYLNAEDLVEKNPGFYEHLKAKEVELKPDDFPFSVKEGQKGMLFSNSRVFIVRAEEAVEQLYGGGAAGHQPEVNQDYAIVEREPNSYVMFAVNGCQLSDSDYDLLKRIFPDAIKKIGYGLPIKPEQLISGLLTLPNAYLAQYGETTDYKGKPFLTAMVTFDKKFLTKPVNIEALLPSIAPNALPLSDLFETPTTIAKIINSSATLKRAFLEYTMGIFNLVHYEFIEKVKKYIPANELSTYLSPEDIDRWENHNIEALMQNNFMEGLTHSIGQITDPKIKESLHIAHIIYENAINVLYSEMRNPQSNWVESDFTFLLMVLYDFGFPGISLEGRIKNLVLSIPNNTDTPEIQEANQQKTLFIHSKLNELIDKFNQVARPEFINYFAQAAFSPLYKHYENYKEQEKASNKPANSLNSASSITTQGQQIIGRLDALESSPVASRLTTNTNHTTPDNNPIQDQRGPREL